MKIKKHIAKLRFPPTKFYKTQDNKLKVSYKQQNSSMGQMDRKVISQDQYIPQMQTAISSTLMETKDYNIPFKIVKKKNLK